MPSGNDNNYYGNDPRNIAKIAEIKRARLLDIKKWNLERKKIEKKKQAKLLKMQQHADKIQRNRDNEKENRKQRALEILELRSKGMSAIEIGQHFGVTDEAIRRFVRQYFTNAQRTEFFDVWKNSQEN